MKRLTGRAPDGTAYLYNMGGTNAAIDRLAAYEDTGLEPEGISTRRWIPVMERVPEENGRYLVRYKRDIVLDYTEVHDDEVRIMRFFVGTGWCYPFLCQPELRAAEQQTVTHWMPLPILPSEG